MKKRRISQKLASTYIIMVVLLVLVLTTGFYQYTRFKLYEEGTSNLNQLCSSTMAQVDSRLKALEETAVIIASNQEYMQAFEAVLQSPEAAEAQVARMKEIVLNNCVKRSELRRVNVLTTHTLLFGTGVVDDAGMHGAQEFVQQLNETGETRKFFLPPHTDNWNRATQVEVLSLIKPLKNRNSDLIGYLELQENMQYLKKICDNQWNNISLGTLILDENNEVFYTNLPDTKENQALMEEVLALSNTFAPRIKETKTAVLSIANSNFNYFKTVLVLEKSVLYHSLNTVLYGVLLMMGLLIVCTCAFVFLSTRAITHPVNMLVERMNKTELENMSEPFEDIKISDYETQILIRTFDRMTMRLKASITKQNALQSAQTKTLFNALQATISPHFLYNTLGGIANMCESQDNEAAAQACYSLTELLHYTSDYTDYDVELNSEMQNLQNYISIMKSRYRQRLEFTCIIDPAAAAFMLPKLTLQPLVENAIKHGLAEQETVVVSMKLKRQGDMLVIEISDNGGGISPELACEIDKTVQKYLSDGAVRDITQPLKFGGMGLVGTLLRLAIYFGEDGFHYTIGQGQDGGACIRLTMSERGNENV